MTPIQIVTIEFEDRTARLMIEQAARELFRVYVSYKHEDGYEAFVETGTTGKEPKELLREHLMVLIGTYGEVVTVDNQISDVYSRDDLKAIFGDVKMTES